MRHKIYSVAPFFLLTTIVAFVLIPVFVSADNPSQGPYGRTCEGAGGFVPLECFRGSRRLADAYNTPELGPFINKVFVGMISLGAILAVLRLAWAGFVYMSSDLPGAKGNAKEIISDTLLGLFLLLSIWLILYQINPQILNLDALKNVSPRQNVGPRQDADKWQVPPLSAEQAEENKRSLDQFKYNGTSGG